MAAVIAIDYTPAYEQGGGIGRYVRELVAALSQLDTSRDYRLFVAGTRAAALPSPPGQNFEWVTTGWSPTWLARFWHRLRLPLPVDTLIGNVQLFHATDFVLPPVRQHTRSLLTVHDLSFIRVPETATPRLRNYLNAVVPRSVHAASHVIADSEATRQDILEFFNIEPHRVSVLLSGVDSRFAPTGPLSEQVRRKYRLPHSPYILAVGTVQPRKNYARLIVALAELRQSGYDVDLVIAGGRGWLDSPIYSTVTEAGLVDHVHFIGFAEDADLPMLYSNALCLAFPSLYEGFGLPILEAMSCGVPVLTSTVSSLPEVAGDAAWLVDPTDQEAILDGLRRLIDDGTLRAELVARGLARASAFTWRRSAENLLKTYVYLLS